MSQETITVSKVSLRRVVGIVIAIAAAALVLGVGWQQRDRLLGAITARIDPDTYQAVFLTGGQTYFGKLASLGAEAYLLTDVYYLPRDDPSRPQQERATLIRRTNEIHRPKDGMIIPTSSILFVENLSSESEVVQAIRRFKSGEQPLATPRPAATPATPSPTR